MIRNRFEAWNIGKGANVIKPSGTKITQSRPRGAAPEAWTDIEKKLLADAYVIMAAPQILTCLEDLIKLIRRGDFGDYSHAMDEVFDAEHWIKAATQFYDPPPES